MRKPIVKDSDNNNHLRHSQKLFSHPPIKVGSLALFDSDKAAVLRVLDSNQISPGATCSAFERAFAKAHGVRHGLFVNSGTDALRIALAAMKEKYGWRYGDEVIVPAVTFVATVNVVLQVGLRPMLVDVGMYDGNMNPEYVEHILSGGKTERVRAMMPVHLFGQPCRMDEIVAIAKRYKLKVIEDSCETMGMGKIWGDVACYSTYVCHLISTGVGGMALTNDEGLGLLMRSYANHGRHTNYLPGTKACTNITKRFQFDRIGYSSRMTEMEAALGIEQLKRLPQEITRRREICRLLYAGLIEFWSDLSLKSEFSGSACMMFPIVIKEHSKIDKWDLCRYLEKNGIETRELMPILKQPCYKNTFRISTHEFSVAKWMDRCGFYIGCHPQMTNGDVEYVVDVFRRFFREKAGISRPKEKLQIVQSGRACLLAA